MGKLLPLSLLLLLTVSCTGHSSYRSSPSKYPPIESSLIEIPPDESSPEEAPPAESPPYSLAYIELDDHGDLWNPEQLYYALREIYIANSVNEGAGALVVVYVHGWKHSASERDENLRDFKAQILQRLVDEEKAFVGRPDANRKARPVVGVYFGWRGNSFDIPKVKQISYWDRNAAAGRVAGTSATEALYGILRMTRKNLASRNVVIGHSMGGLIVERAVIPAFESLVIEGAAGQNDYYRVLERIYLTLSRDQVKPLQGTNEELRWDAPVDLVVLVNPASPALEAKKFVNMLERWSFQRHANGENVLPYIHPVEDAPRWRPLIISITSEGDFANRVVFPLGNFLGTGFRQFRVYKDLTKASGGSRRTQKEQRPLPQRYFSTRTGGHVPMLATHVVEHDELEMSSGSSVGMCSQDEFNAPSSRLAKDPEGKLGMACYRLGRDRFRIQELPSDRSINPTLYWIMQVEKEVIPDHSKIFESQFYGMLRGLLEIADVLKPTDPAAREEQKKAAEALGVVGQGSRPLGAESSQDLDQEPQQGVQEERLLVATDNEYYREREDLDRFTAHLPRAPERPIGETPPGSVRPEDPRPEDPRPEDPKPEDPKPEDPKPEDPRPEDPKPEDPRPEDPKPEDPRPEDPKPEDSKPEDPRPQDDPPKVPDTQAVLCAPIAPGNLAVHEVVQGECLALIAEEHWGEQLWLPLYRANRSVVGRNPHLIHPGQCLQVPPKPESRNRK